MSAQIKPMYVVAGTGDKEGKYLTEDLVGYTTELQQASFYTTYQCALAASQRCSWLMGLDCEARKVAARIEILAANTDNVELVAAARQAYDVYDSDYSASQKYAMIFRPDVSGVLLHELDRRDYFDPDTTYEEDVKFFIRWLDEQGGRSLAGLAPEDD